MTLVLSPELEQMISQKIESGEYSSPNEVIAHGLRLIREQDAIKQMRLEELRREVAIGADAIARGEYIEYSSAKELMDEIKAGDKADAKFPLGIGS